MQEDGIARKEEDRGCRCDGGQMTALSGTQEAAWCRRKVAGGKRGRIMSHPCLRVSMAAPSFLEVTCTRVLSLTV